MQEMQLPDLYGNFSKNNEHGFLCTVPVQSSHHPMPNSDAFHNMIEIYFHRVFLSIPIRLERPSTIRCVVVKSPCEVMKTLITTRIQNLRAK
jgi:hypothetical protein